MKYIDYITRFTKIIANYLGKDIRVIVEYDKSQFVENYSFDELMDYVIYLETKQISAFHYYIISANIKDDIFPQISSVPDHCHIHYDNNIKISCMSHLPLFMSNILTEYMDLGDPFTMDIRSQELRDLDILNIYKTNDKFYSNSKFFDMTYVYISKKYGIVEFDTRTLKYDIVMEGKNFLYYKNKATGKRFILFSDKEVKHKPSITTTIPKSLYPQNFIKMSQYTYSNTNYNIHNVITSVNDKGITSINEKKIGFKNFNFFDEKGNDDYAVGYDTRMFGCFVTKYETSEGKKFYLKLSENEKTVNTILRSEIAEQYGIFQTDFVDQIKGEWKPKGVNYIDIMTVNHQDYLELMKQSGYKKQLKNNLFVNISSATPPNKSFYWDIILGIYIYINTQKHLTYCYIPSGDEGKSTMKYYGGPLNNQMFYEL